MYARFNTLFFCLAALGLAVAGLWLMARELAPFDYAYRVGQDPTTLARDDGLPRPASTGANRVLLDICAQRLQGLSFMLSPTGAKAAIAGNCLEMAGAATRSMPAYSYAHYVSALALLRLGRAGSAQEALELSQKTARNEQWIAELRVALAEDNPEGFAGYIIGTAHPGDLALLAQSARGIHSIARRYVSNPLFRERITGIVETLPDTVQARFVHLVRAEARAVTRLE